MPYGATFSQDSKAVEYLSANTESKRVKNTHLKFERMVKLQCRLNTFAFEVALLIHRKD